MSSLALPTLLPATDARLRRRLTLAAALLAFLVVGLGAYVRLSDAGLGCPDWPGCYGQLLGVPDTAHEHAAAAAAFPGKAVDRARAWKEMVHRYAAGSLGLLVATLFALAWRPREHPWPRFESGLLALIALQAALGMWTVTLLLKPVIVTAHLLGGMLTWSLLASRAAELAGGGRDLWPGAAARGAPAPLAGLAWATLALLLAQIALGGWVSSNYAGLACPDLPTCRGAWWPAGDWGSGFQLLRDLGSRADGTPLPLAALEAIHWTHRLGALAITGAVGGLAAALLARPGWRRHGGLLAGLLLLQAGLGIANVAFQLPLPLAVAHNLGAALLLAALLATARALTRSPRP